MRGIEVNLIIGRVFFRRTKIARVRWVKVLNIILSFFIYWVYSKIIERVFGEKTPVQSGSAVSGWLVQIDKTIKKMSERSEFPSLGSTKNPPDLF